MKKEEITMKEQELMDAFIRLIATTDFAKINVKKITKEANVTRTYFYDFFDNKEDIALEATLSIILPFLECISASITESNKINMQVVQQGVESVIRQRNVIKNLFSIQSEHYNFQKNVQLKLKILTKKRIHSYKLSSPSRFDFFAELFSSALITTITWIVSQKNISPKNISEIIGECIGEGTRSIIH